jgi:hypothetical protein
MKKSVRKSSKSRAAQSKPRMGVPTVKQRLDMIERAIAMAAAGLGIDAHELSAREPNVQPISLNAGDVLVIVRLIAGCLEHTYYIEQNLSPDTLSMLAATDDQREVFEPVELLGGVR